MAELFKTSNVWVVDYQYDGHPRRWFKAVASNSDAAIMMTTLLRDLYGNRARLVALRKATEEEERQYVRGEEPANAYCPTSPDAGSP